ncbi:MULTISPECIES: aminodeoxychorismate/anthranilate synthase component II [Archaeoglobus]|jgi:anthranilate synthase component 2|uniref:Anthranilate synthase component 2 n=2 Tax=Archaeoglobus fulgidus TaxID=2234 RepID=TRPG_ARCFU|nr:MULTISPECIES: aminodeoxychorismate/anthranilate synthase component II [Archaeoglobus]O28670.1 RecName: Full=Anthranilate synthase component 2; Short=AS; Short=ASII; AltName: Full=Anthranilate synthase, GATase component; AltName: Full=Anthranilate synthase, glutamine amidotransferase component [Archaeoglobus fulgidus DSM 4304]AAB89647.1 anthranilate synthase component II (trpG) [Archaeoglobus fulgidus DSM 4304]KUJ93833.1 MAG: Anthranilate synthase component 2 [Archaeoglobus fulgidus]KUK07288.
MIVVVDCKDSFVYNLVEYISLFDKVRVVEKESAGLLRKMSFDGVVISPGPGKPDRSLEFVFKMGVPVLGVCLGHQMIAEVFGGKVGRVEPVHGKTSLVEHDGRGIFKGVRNPLRAGRYHSLAVLEPPEGFEVCAKSEDGVVMGLRRGKIHGVQFHPESVLTEDGVRMIRNFVEMCHDG